MFHTSKFFPFLVNAITQGLGAAKQHTDMKKENKERLVCKNGGRTKSTAQGN